ncbi:MAG TPA: hypothetical protein VM307_04685, partial [Egibacteraceae bacterium]|nr:hypothetical protein [Egibacteraceae bacterium]
GLTQLTVSCEPETPTPCSPEIPVVQCTEAPPQTHYVLDDDAVTIEGNALTFTVDLRGPLADIAGELSPGTVLRTTRLWSYTGAGVARFGPSYCWGTYCGDVLGDRAYGRPWTVGS